MFNTSKGFTSNERVWPFCCLLSIRFEDQTGSTNHYLQWWICWFIWHHTYTQQVSDFEDISLVGTNHINGASNEYYLAYRNFQWFVLHVAHVSSPFAWVMISTWPGPPDSESSYNLYKSIKAEKIAVSSVSLMKDLLSWQAANLNNCLRQTSGTFWLMWFELD